MKVPHSLRRAQHTKFGKVLRQSYFQTCLETKSLSMFYETFWNMSIKQTSQPCAGSAKSVALARRMSFIATYMLGTAEYPVSNNRLPSRLTLPEEFARSNRLSVTYISPRLCGT